MGCTDEAIRRLIVRAKRSGKRVKDIAAMFEVCRWTVWKWCKRAHHRGRTSYRDLSRKPLRTYLKVTREIENAIIVLRDSFNWGTQRIALNLHSPPGYIHHLLSTVTGGTWKSVRLSRQTINSILKKHRRNGSPYLRNRKDWHFYRARDPNNLWHIDIKGPFLLDGKRLYALLIIDDHSRFIVLCRMLSSIKKEDVIAALKFSEKKFGKPKRLLCDNGPQFVSNDLKGWCKTNEVVYDPCPPYYPEAKGKVERTIRNFKEEFLVLDKVFESASELLPEYIDWFNNTRWSLGIEGTPASFYVGDVG
jgi:transposase InsO family protein